MQSPSLRLAPQPAPFNKGAYGRRNLSPPFDKGAYGVRSLPLTREAAR